MIRRVGRLGLGIIRLDEIKQSGSGLQGLTRMSGACMLAVGRPSDPPLPYARQGQHVHDELEQAGGQIHAAQQQGGPLPLHEAGGAGLHASSTSSSQAINQPIS